MAQIDPQHIIAQCNPLNSGALLDNGGNKVGFQATLSDDYSVVYSWMLPGHINVSDMATGRHFIVTVAELHAILDFASQLGF